ncbi:MAG: spore germination protein [Bacillota bacterium]|nr:spore germination protein [Bacillota bacterium]
MAEENTNTECPVGEAVISTDLSSNIEKLKRIFAYPKNEDFAIRELYIELVKKKAALLYIEGIVNEQVIDKFIIDAIINNSNYKANGIQGIELVKLSLAIVKVKEVNAFTRITETLLDGYSVLLIDGYDRAISIDTVKYEHRSIERSETENITKGPHEGFVEAFKINISLIRKHLKNEKLVTESIKVGYKTRTRVLLMYRNDMVDENLVNNIKERLGRVQTDAMITTSILGQFIEDHDYSVVPTILYTELPDRAASYIESGHVVILVDNSPSVLIAPATFWVLFHTPEDTYHRWIAGNFIRFIRIVSVFIMLFTPALYIAATNYHPEMIPTDLLLAIAASREKVPFPVVFEVVGMELAFEVIREASIRIPTSMGATIGIVGALILGQAAVQANIISPLVVIIVALTGVSSFAVSNTDLNMSIRISRFFFTFCGMVMGFLGIAVGIVVFLGYAISIRSFGVPFFAPITPHSKSSRDMLFRSSVKDQNLRPLLTNLKLIYKNRPFKK